MATYRFKISLAGDGAVGKTSWVHRLCTGKFKNRHVPTLGVEVHSVNYRCTDGTSVEFDIWDCAGTDKYVGLGEGYYIGSDGAIIMCDLTNGDSCATSASWYHNIKRICSDIPVVVSGNKCESPDAYINMQTGERRGINFCNTSVAANKNVHLPLLILARKLRPDDSFEFVI